MAGPGGECPGRPGPGEHPVRPGQVFREAEHPLPLLVGHQLLHGRLRAGLPSGDAGGQGSQTNEAEHFTLDVELDDPVAEHRVVQVAVARGRA